MSSLNLTESMRSTIKLYRKKNKIRTDDLSKSLGKGASYVSQLENGKIQEIDRDLFEKIIKTISNNNEDDYNELLKLLDDAIITMTDEELEREKWMTTFNFDIRIFPITNSLIEYIKENLQFLNMTGEDLIKVINENKYLNDPDNQITEYNKLYIDITRKDNLSYLSSQSIKFNLPLNFIDKIISGEEKGIKYITMKGILWNILILRGFDEDAAHDESDKLLYKNKFWTIYERRRYLKKKQMESKINNMEFNLYDALPNDYEKDYVNSISKINDMFSFFRDKNILYTCEKLSQFLDNMKFDLPFMMAVISLPYNKLSELDFKSKQNLLEDIKILINKYSSIHE